MAGQIATSWTAEVAKLEPQFDAGAKRRARVVAAMGSIFASAALAAGVLLLLGGCMTTPTLMAAVAAAAFACIVASAFDAGEKTGRLLGRVVAAVAVVALVALLAVPDCRVGLFSLVNGVLSRIDDAFDAYFALIAAGGTVASSVLFGVLLGLLVGLGCWAAVRQDAVAVGLLVLVIFVAGCLRVGTGAGLLGAALCLFGWCLHCRGAQLRRAVNGPVPFLVDLVAIAVMVAVAAGLCLWAFTPQAALSSLHQSVLDTVDSARYGTDTLPEGDLSQASAMNQDDGITRLTLSLSGAPNDDLLLQGFVGATYENGAWSALTHTAYEGSWTGMQSWLQTQGFQAATQRAAYDDQAALAGGEGTTQYSADVSVQNANRRYLYVPYSLRSVSGASFNQDLDGAAVSQGLFGASSYSYTADSIAATGVITDTSWLSSHDGSFVQAEAVYDAFVEENYLAISDEDKEVLTAALFDEATWNSAIDASEQTIISRVRTMLSTLASYTDSPDTAPAGRNFCDWFLNVARKGNSCAFATVATLAFRSQGIPARYVEGYRADAQTLASAAQSGSDVTLTSADAHAWTEIYLKGQGWTPVEVTPGFFTNTIYADQVIDVNEAQSSGSGEEQPQVGSVGGDVPEADRGDQAQEGLSVLAMIGVVLAALFIAVLVAALVGILQRQLRIRRRQRYYTDVSQSVAVPALYRYLSRLMTTSGIGFDATKPLECCDELAKAYPSIDVREYRRVISLHQRFAFGGYELRPNEMRTIRRFNNRVHGVLPAPTTLRARFRRYFVEAL